MRYLMLIVSALGLWVALAGATDDCKVTLRSLATPNVPTVLPDEVVTHYGSCVYICTGPNSKRYHASSSCRGLRRCSGSIKAVSREDALRSSDLTTK